VSTRVQVLLVIGFVAAVVYPWLVPNYLITVGMLMFFMIRNLASNFVKTVKLLE
jgi:hypothetical protein